MGSLLVLGAFPSFLGGGVLYSFEKAMFFSFLVGKRWEVGGKQPVLRGVWRDEKLTLDDIESQNTLSKDLDSPCFTLRALFSYGVYPGGFMFMRESKKCRGVWLPGRTDIQ